MKGIAVPPIVQKLMRVRVMDVGEFVPVHKVKNAIQIQQELSLVVKPQSVTVLVEGLLSVELHAAVKINTVPQILVVIKGPVSIRIFATRQ